MTNDSDDSNTPLLLAVLVVVAIIARRFNIAPSILLVVAGILLALTPGLPRIELAPELVLFGILPPLIYSAGVAMSWFSTCARSRCWHLVRCTTLASASPARIGPPGRADSR